MVVLNIGLLAAVAAAQTRPVAIVGGMLIDGTGRAPLTDSTIIVQDGRIRDVRVREKVPVPRGAEVIDANGKILCRVPLPTGRNKTQVI